MKTSPGPGAPSDLNTSEASELREGDEAQACLFLRRFNRFFHLYEELESRLRARKGLISVSKLGTVEGDQNTALSTKLSPIVSKRYDNSKPVPPNKSATNIEGDADDTVGLANLHILESPHTLVFVPLLKLDDQGPGLVLPEFSSSNVNIYKHTMFERAVK